MPSISSLMNVAKEALLAHQASISVAGHNVANVNTPGYSRQVTSLTTNVSTPEGTGNYGNGVKIQEVTRRYDQFLVQRLMDQSSSITNLEAKQQSMRIIETTFNEVPGLAVNDLMSQFWESWQDLSNNPELTASRQSVVQQAELLSEQFKAMSAEITQAKYEIGVSLKSSIDDINELTTQLANLNVTITSSETPLQKQNDLRDTRDKMLGELADLVDITFFESSNGAYTILLTDGHALVETNEHWELDWKNDTLSWISTNALGNKTAVVIGKNYDMGGKVGGLVEMSNSLLEGDPDNYLGQLDALANALVREVNQQHTQGAGLVSFSDRLISTELAKDAVLLHTTVDTKSAADAIEAGTFYINDREIGRINGSVITSGLAMGKTYNAAQAINDAHVGVEARMTTLAAGRAITTGMANNDTVSFTVNGVSVTYTNTTGAALSAADTAANVAGAIQAAIDNYNTTKIPQENIPKLTLEAVVGNNLNGGAENSIVLRNTNKGDESEIVIADLAATAPENNLGLANGTYVADATHNDGNLSIFATESPITIDGGADDLYMAHLGWAGSIEYSNRAAIAAPAAPAATEISFELNGHAITVAVPALSDAATTAKLVNDAINLVAIQTGVSTEVGDGTNGGVTNSIVFSSDITDIIIKNYKENSASVASGAEIIGFGSFSKLGVSSADESANDGKLTYTSEDNKIPNSIMGLKYADNLTTDNAAFEIWIYNNDGSLALSRPVSVSMERAYNLPDVAASINISILNAINDSSVTAPWVEATVSNNQLILSPDSNHNFAFGSDTSNFLAAAGINTLFTGYNARTIGINANVSDNLEQLAAGRINQYGELFTGDNSNALLISNIQRDESITFNDGSTDTLDGFYNSLIGKIGLKGRSINSDLEYNEMVSNQLDELRDSTSGVSLDEEMANLIRFQHAYSAAAKLISTGDEMLETLLNTF